MLHTVNKSPFDRNSLQSCLRFAQANDAILVYEDGIYAAFKGTVIESQIESALLKCKVYVLKPDCEARGMKTENLISGIQTVDYNGFVELTVQHSPVQAWL